jgi:ABC-type multidrug transport system fused ATPase/permease subunit
LLARVDYRDSEIIIMDEPTAALDPISEDQVYHNVNILYMNKTILFITHRLAITRYCDEILVFEDGVIKEHGTHDYLLSNTNGVYSKLYAIQSKYYQKEEKEL